MSSWLIITMAILHLLSHRVKRALWFLAVIGVFYAVSAQKEKLESPSPDLSLQEIDDRLQVYLNQELSFETEIFH